MTKRVISVWSPKGGVGKTTISIHLAEALQRAGYSVLVSDLDPQRSALWVASQGKLGFRVIEGYPSSAPAEDFLLVDHPPRAELMPLGSIVIVPVRAGALDWRASQDALRLLEAVGRTKPREILLCASAVDMRRNEEAAACSAMGAASVIRSRSIYSRAIGRGETVFSASILERGLYGAREAAKEMHALASRVIEADQRLSSM